jgi:hypothetical protein
MAYLLRCWHEGPTWRYSLEEIGTDEKRGFASIDELVSYLLARSVPPCEESEAPVAGK